ncbi:hypothetical protein ACLKA6_013540 [Drosophila palustris]
MKCVELFVLLLSSLIGCQANGRVLMNWNSSIMGIDSAELVANPCQDVRLAGFICVDCETLGFCSFLNGKWQTVEMSKCQTQNGFHCSDEGTFGCTWQPRCQVPVRGKFYCQGVGIYPDPYDCRSYHECDAHNVDTPHQCTNGAAYSLLTNSCTLSRDSDYCLKKQYSCDKVGQTGAWPANNSYYYVCQKEEQVDTSVVYPLMMKCHNGYVFNGHSCVPATKIYKRSQKIQQREQHCQNGIRYPADNPKAYFTCHDGKLVFEACPLGSYFDAAVKSCLKDTQSCEEGKFYAAKSKYGFNYCMQGNLIYQRCPIKYYFDSELNACRMLEETCKDFTTSPAETSYGFYKCIKGKLIYDTCPDGTISYDENYDICITNETF